MKFIKSPHVPGIILFILFLFIGLSVYKDYGISWDEPTQRYIGEINYNYAFHNDGALKDIPDRYYGAGFEIPLTFLEKTLHITDSRDVFFMRHIVTHFFFLFAAFCGYLLSYRIFRNRFIACLGFLMLVLHPRIYAHSFFNTKDIPTVSMFIISFLLVDIAFQKNKNIWYIMLGLSCGYLTGIRIIGALLFLLVCTFIILDWFFLWKDEKKIKSHILYLVSFIVSFCAMLLISYPNLWTKPLENFVEAGQHFSHFIWPGHVLFMGQNISGTDLPFYYMPVWFLITTPLLFIVAGIIGFFWFIVAFFRSPATFLRNSHKRNFLLYTICLSAPIAMVIIMHSELYDDWRHMYFVYPAFVFMALFAISKLSENRYKRIIPILFVVQIVCTGFFMVKNHPYQQVYFNVLVPHEKEYLRKNYELDYWGSAFKQGLEYIAAHDTSSKIKVEGNTFLIINNLLILPPAIRDRIQNEEDTSKANYYITNFRYHPEDFSYRHIYYEQHVLNSTILRVYKLK